MQIRVCHLEWGRISGYPMDVTKILVSVDERLLSRIDRAARAAGLSRSAYLARLAERELDIRSGPGLEAHVRRALTRLDKLFASQGVREEATRAVRAERDARLP